MQTLTIADSDMPIAVSVAWDRWDGDRPGFSYRVESEGTLLAEGSDLRLGSGAEPRLADALETLLTFLGAFAESVDYGRRTGTRGENADLFPAELAELAEAIGSDGFTSLAWEVKETDA